ncbi:DinB family protein [Winogradskyella sp. 3972H.M.0a.05]|uniref:DinB family protein n=1 Tax=Winogradskyella sp. 3972H.M.0a.05 TaxID=2950277 RepID=UPI0033936C23
MMKLTISKAIEVLQQTPKTLHAFLYNLSDDWIFCDEGSETWNAYDIVGHLIHGEKTDWMQRLDIILKQGDNNTFEPFDRFAQFENSKGKSLHNLLGEFSELRSQNLEQLKALNITESQFSLKAIHPELGEVTLGQLLATWVTHDLGHIAQIARVMAKQYKQDVGPWEAYISILHK